MTISAQKIGVICKHCQHQSNMAQEREWLKIIFQPPRYQQKKIFFYEKNKK